MPTDALPFERVGVIRDPVARSGSENMALDEALLHSTQGDVLLRIYGWMEPTVSFGYFETARSARHAARGRPVVRRWTGGGIVEHGDDVTYSLCVPRNLAFTALRSAESYRRIHAAVAHALRRCGSAAESQETPASVPPFAPFAPPVNACFERPVLHDLMVDGRKVAGGAQRRSRAGLLHQGSIRIELADPLAGDAWKIALSRDLPASLAGVLEERVVTPAELSLARTLAATKYSTAAWTDRS